MTDLQKRKNAKEFVNYWHEHSKKEKQDDQTFWNMFLRDILGVEKPEKIIQYQKETDSNATQWIDAYIKGTNIIIEQKSSGVNLLEPSNGSTINAFEQAKNYDNNMNKSNKANWIITCNFDKFLIYNMDDIKKQYVEIKLDDLPTCYDNFNFLIDKSAKVIDLETTVSKEAGKIIGNIYNKIEQLLIEQDSLNPQTQKYLNEFCVRLVFCCFAEDSGLFSKRQFRDYIEKADINHLQSDLLELFEILNTKERRAFLREDLNAFPYVNGELFLDKIDIPPLNESIKKLILEDACDGFDWSKINPTIFGAIFESTLNPETRSNEGMHYTSIENIHKVIDPLFLDDLKKEFSEIRKSSQINIKTAKLNELQNKISKLTFLDPACGSGNFLTETYLELRRLENNILRELINLNKGQRALFSSDLKDLIKVHIQQFYGIEINDFAVAVSKTALWIAEYQMYLETLDLYTGNNNNDFLPLDSYENVIESNALTIDWNDVIEKSKCNYIIGNPPFVGAMKSKGRQREDIMLVFPECKKPGEIDYVSGWYIKAANYIYETSIRCAFVSTNSICQGQQVELLWEPLLKKVKIDFAYQTFQWDSEANIKAHVHCVIIGFSNYLVKSNKIIYTNNGKIKATNINGYLLNEPNFYVNSSTKQISNMPTMHMGVMARDGGYLIMNADEYKEYISKEPQGAKYIRQYMMGKEFLNGIKRYCFWLVDVEPSELKNCPLLMKRLQGVKESRLASPAIETQQLAATPMLFAQLAQPQKKFIALPSVSSEKRKYIPMDFLDPNIIVGNKLYVIEDVGLYHFGVLMSIVHNYWIKTVAGRLETRINYSNTIVYNNFPWPNPSKEQKEKIERTAQLILDIRKKYSESSLADLYGELTMPKELVKAHLENDKAVMEAYGFDWKKITESEVVSKLMNIYQDLIKEAS